jgi:alanine racemase
LLLFQLNLYVQAPRGQRKRKVCPARRFQDFYNKAQIDGINTTLSLIILILHKYIYGLFSDNLEALLIIPMNSLASIRLQQIHLEIFRLGNLTFGLKYKIYDQKWKISTGLQYQVNT